MRVEAIPNRGLASMAFELERSLLWAEQVDIASAYVTVAALRQLEHFLEDAQKKKRQLTVRLLFGLYQRFTPPAALDKMLKLQKAYPARLFVRVATNNRFHWKLYLVKNRNSRRLYVGSANLTEDGLSASGELSLKVTANAKDRITHLLEKEFEDLWRDESFILNKSVLNKYQKVKRPPTIVTFPQGDDAISSLLRDAERPPKLPLAKTKPRVAFVPDDVSDETARIVRTETNWEQNGWNYMCFPRRDWFDHIYDAGVFLYVVFGARPKEYWIRFHRIRDSVELVTPDGNYFIAHSRLANGWWRRYDKVKAELDLVGLTWKKIEADAILNERQIEVLCRLLHVRKEQVLKS